MAVLTATYQATRDAQATVISNGVPDPSAGPFYGRARGSLRGMSDTSTSGA
jgi:hypothetical protein